MRNDLSLNPPNFGILDLIVSVIFILFLFVEIIFFVSYLENIFEFI